MVDLYSWVLINKRILNVFLQVLTIILLLYWFLLVFIDFPSANIIANILVDIEIPLSASVFFVE